MLSSLLSLTLLTMPQQPVPAVPVPLPQMPVIAGNGASLMRYVDFHADLARPGVVAVVGTLDKWKEGRRKRLEEGEIGGGATRMSVSGTQYFKVPVKAPLAVRVAFVGEVKGKLDVEFDLQVARLADGKERWQATTPNHAPVSQGMLALFVMAPPAAGKKPALLHVIPFDAALDTGPSPQDRFLDTMHDYVSINRRVFEIERAIEDFRRAPEEDRRMARAQLGESLAAPVDLHQPENRTLQQTQVGPWELRARELMTAPPAAGK